MLRRYPRAKLVAATSKWLVAGNSVADGQGTSSDSMRWSAVVTTLAPLAGTGITLDNRAVPGMSIKTNAGAGTMVLQAPTIINAMDATRENYLILQEGVNDPKVTGFVPSVTLAAWDELCTLYREGAKAKGAKLHIILCTTPPAGSIPSGENQAYVNTRMACITETNTRLRRDYRRYADQLVDFAALPIFAAMTAANVWDDAAFIASGLYGQNNGLPMDKTHMGNAGHAYMAAGLAKEIKRIRTARVPA
jgi:lysophospholipase L1-like esterase